MIATFSRSSKSLYHPLFRPSTTIEFSLLGTRPSWRIKSLKEIQSGFLGSLLDGFNEGGVAGYSKERRIRDLIRNHSGDSDNFSCGTLGVDGFGLWGKLQQPYE